MQYVLFEQFRGGKQGELDLGVILNMLSECADYDASKQRPIAGPYKLDRPDNEPYLRKLEEIDSSWVKKYLENVLVGIKKNDRGGVRAYRSQHRETRVMYDEDGEPTDESELLIDEGNGNYVDIDAAKAKLPYLLKRMYDKSRMLGISVMSLLIAYERARYVKNPPAPRHILDMDVYYMNKDGTLGNVLPSSANSGKVFPAARAWVAGEDADAYFRDAMELLRVCDVLGIDITRENPADYQRENIEKLKITYITRNRDYLRGVRNRNLTVLDTLSNARVSDFKAKTAQTKSIALLAREVQSMIVNSDDRKLRSIVEAPPDPIAMNQFFRTYGEYMRGFRITMQQRQEAFTSRRKVTLEDPNLQVIPVLADFETADGFLCSTLGGNLPQLFNIQQFHQPIGPTYAIAHASGYLFIVTDGHVIEYLDALELERYIRDYLCDNFTNRYNKNHKYGRWESCYT